MILYEDAALVVLDKPAGLSSEEGVPAALRAHWNAPDAFVGVVHRLDTGVSGLMVYAPGSCRRPEPSGDPKSGRLCRAGWPRRGQSRRAAVRQAVPRNHCRCAGRAAACRRGAAGLPVQGQPQGQGVPGPRKGVREAVLEYRILATAGENSLAEITLHTGRTHQIRVQFASRKHPLYGDGKYGSRQKGSIALQSCGLRFVHPDTGKPMAFSLPLPAAAPWKEFLELGE